MFGRYDDKSFKEQLEKNLTWLRQAILNLDDYVPREEFDSLRERERTLSRNVDSLQIELVTSTRRLEAAEKNCRDLERSLEKISAECEYYREAYAELDAAYKIIFRSTRKFAINWRGFSATRRPCKDF